MGALVQPTSKIVGRAAGAWSGATPLAGGRDSGATKSAKLISARVAGAWVLRYSTPAFTMGSTNITKEGSGASASGRVYSDYLQANAAPAGEYGAHHYTVQYLDGDNGVVIETPSDPNTRFYRDFGGVPNGSNSGYATTRFTLTFFDDDSGAIYTEILTVNLRWTNTIPAFSPHNNVHGAGSGTEYVPAGATSLTIRRVGGGGGGGGGVYNSGLGDYKGGNGGGSGAYKPQTIAIAPGDVGVPIYWTADGGASLWPNVGGTTSTTGTLAAGSVSDSAPGGTGGASGAAVVSGSSTGGSPAGNNGTSGSLGAGGSGGASPYGGYGKGGDGGYPGGGSQGGDGAVVFEWS